MLPSAASTARRYLTAGPPCPRGSPRAAVAFVAQAPSLFAKAPEKGTGLRSATLAQSAEFVQDLLESARLEARELTLQTAPIDLRSVVRETASSDPTDRLVVSVPPRPVIVDVDARRIRQILTELVSNARKFSALDDPVELTLTTPTPDQIGLAVRDHGLGIPEAQRAGLFARFYQAHAHSHRSGMGLGLYISRQIVEMHGGRIAADFPPDGGTRFVLCLPRGRRTGRAGSEEVRA